MLQKTTRKGIKNLRNTCFMNSIFQVLLTIPELTTLLIESSKQAQESSFIYLFTSIFLLPEAVELDTLKVLVGKCFSLFEGSEPYTKQDAQEFFYLFLNKIQSELRESEHRENLEKLFKGETLIKSSCGKKLQDIFYQLSLSIDQIESKFMIKRNDEENHLISGVNKRDSIFCCKKEAPITINDCLRKYFENFSEYKINTCECKNENCPQQIGVINYPKYLFISLKRYEFDGKLKKISKKVFPLTSIDIYGKKYELISIVEHIDKFLRKHYRAYCKDKGIWTMCDDSTVKVVDISYILNVEPYIMLYKYNPADASQSFPSNQGSFLQQGLLETIKIDQIHMDYKNPRVESEGSEKYRKIKSFDFQEQDDLHLLLKSQQIFQKPDRKLFELENTSNIRTNIINAPKFPPESLEPTQSIDEDQKNPEKINGFKPMFPISVIINSSKANGNSSLKFFKNDFNSSATVFPFSNYQTTNDKSRISPSLEGVLRLQNEIQSIKSLPDIPRISDFPLPQVVPQSPHYPYNPLLSSDDPLFKKQKIEIIKLKMPSKISENLVSSSNINEEQFAKTTL